MRISRSRTYGARTGLSITRADGCWIWAEGRGRILDCLASAGALSLGHNHPAVVDAVRQARLGKVPTLALDFDTPPLRAFLGELGPALPRELGESGVLHLCPPSGAVAVEAALTLAEVATNRRGLIAFDGGFHGCTRLARSLSTAADLGRAKLGTFPDVTILPFPDDERGWAGLAQPEADAAVLASLRAALGLESPQRQPPAAVILECVQGEAGGGRLSAPFLCGVRAACDEAGVVLVVDEVQTGAGRTGTMWSFEPSGIVPDVLIASKGLGGGYPIAAVIARSELDRWSPGDFTGTFRGTTDGFVAAATTLRVLREEHLVAAAADRGRELRGLLADACAGSDMVERLSGRGLLVGVQLRRGGSDAIASRIQAEMLERGVLAEVGGRHDEVLRLLPPLVVSSAELALLAEAFADALEVVSDRRVAS